MGKKTKKTKWRTLEIPPAGKFFENTNPFKWEDGQALDGRRTPSANYQQYYEKTGRRQSSNVSPNVTTSNAKYPSVKEETKTTVEDEYTKITTPRQDVLFKKGYLTRRKVPETISENSVDQSSDDIAQDCANNEDFNNYTNGDDNVQQYMCSAPQSYIDPSALYYGGGYEIYDPYSGNITVVVGPPAGQYPSNTSCQPILTSVPCRSVPLQPVQWFNPVPSSEWCCSYSPQSDKMYSTDSQNGSGINSESSGVPESPPEMIEEHQLGSSSPVFPPSYVYPGYMFGAPIYNMDGVNVQYYAPQSPALSSSEQTSSKRRKKRKRRRRAGETGEESESSIDDNCNRSISSNECILDFQSPTESLDYEDEPKTETSYVQTAGPYSSLPQGIVNAPEFVPSELSLSTASANTCNDNDGSFTDNVPSSISINSCHDDKLVNVLPSENLSNKSTGLNVFCKAFDNRESKHDLERVSSSNNSDSGISSPGSEDTSKGNFRCVEAKTERSEEVKKKPRSRKTNKAKNKQAEEKVYEYVQGVKKPNQKDAKPASRNEPKKEKNVKRDETESAKKFPLEKEARGDSRKANKANKNLSVISPKRKQTQKKIPKKVENCARKTTSDEKPRKDGPTTFLEVRSSNEDETTVTEEPDVCAEELKSTVVNEHAVVEGNNEKVVDDVAIVLKSNEFESCGGCKSNCYGGDIEDEHCAKCNYQKDETLSAEASACNANAVDDDCVGTAQNKLRSSWSDRKPAKTVTSPMMLNKYVKIEPKPVLAKLVDLDELTRDSSTAADVLEEISISEFSSCRENAAAAPLKPPPRRKKSRKNVEHTARQIVDEIIERAEERILSSMPCDKLQLPITQAVTKWLNEHGGLPPAVAQNKTDLLDTEKCNDDEDDEDESADIVTNIRKTKSKKSKANCVIC